MSRKKLPKKKKRKLKIFPQSFIENKIDRKILAKIIFSNECDSKKKLEDLEKILHPKVRKKYLEFIESERKNGTKIALTLSDQNICFKYTNNDVIQILNEIIELSNSKKH